MKARWLRRSLWLAGFACLWVNVCDDPPLASGSYLVDVTQHSAILGLITADPVVVTATVRNDKGQVVVRMVDERPRRRHHFAAAGLSPGSSFEYLLESEGCEPERGTIRTAPPGDRGHFKIAFLGDSGDQPWWVWLQRTPALHLPAKWGWFADSPTVSRIGSAVAEARPDFVLHLGDIVYPRGQHAHYRSGFFRPFAPVLRDSPVFAVLGNHDVMDSGGLQAIANLRPPSALDSRDRRNISFAWGPVRIIGLDCNSDYSGERYELGHPAQVFLSEQLAKCTEPWIVVASHFPMLSASRQGNRAELLKALRPELQHFQVSLYLSGHDHGYQRFGKPPEGGPPLVVSGGGGKDLYEIRKDSHAAAHAAALVSAHHWCSAEVSGSSLTVRSHGLDGSLLDSFDLPLPTGEDLVRLRRDNPARANRVAELQQ